MAGEERVVLSVPARGEYARTVRMTAAELAVRAGMNIDDVDDVRLAVEEAFVLACSREDLAEVRFEFGLGDGSLDIAVGPIGAQCEEAAADTQERYAAFILESVCDEYRLETRADGCWIRLVKRTA